MNFTVWLIRGVHLSIVVFMFISVFINNKRVKEVALLLLGYLLIKYLTGHKKCVLTELEHKVLGEENYEKGFLHQLMFPTSNIPENYFNNGLLIIHLLWIVILVYQLSSMDCDFVSLIF